MRPIRALTGLRAVAAVWVVLFHYRADLLTLFPSARAISPLLDSGYLGVDAFFALSGFVLAYNYAGQLQSWSWAGTRDFLRNRVARVWPAHLVTLHLDLLGAALVGGLGITDGGHRRTVGAYVQNLTLTHDWFTDRPSFNAPAWSVSAEWAAYLLCPVLLVALARVRRARTAALLTALVYAAMMAVYALWATPNGNVVHGGLVRVVAGFTAGLLLFRVYQVLQVPAQRSWWGAAAASLLAAALAGVLLWVPASRSGGYWLAPALGLLVLLLAMDKGPLGRALSGRSFVFWGEASYCLYLTHVLVQPLLHRAADPADVADAPLVMRLLTAGLYVAVLAAAAVALRKGVEVPARRLLRSRPRRPAVAAPLRLAATVAD